MKEKLVFLARQASQGAYAPYSNFKVGAAVLLTDGQVICGSNQENASYSLTMCAERVALFYAQSAFAEQKIVAIAIATTSNDKLITPCGACRQVMSEVAKRQHADFEVIMSSPTEIVTMTTAELLPLAF